MNNTYQTSRIEGLDLIRTLAILFVLFIHSVPPDVDNIEYINSLSGFSKIYHFTCFSIGRLGVPLFFFLSGYLLLSREYNQEKTKHFYRNNFLSLLLTWEIWIFIYDWTMAWYNDKPLHLSTVFKNMLFIEPSEMFHAWYMEVIIGIYIFIPYLARALRLIEDRPLLIIAAVKFIYFFIVPTLNHFRTSPLVNCLDLNFAGGIYWFYLIAGYAFKRFENHLKDLPKLSLIAIALMLTAATTQLQIIATNRAIYHVWYDFCLLPITSMLIFICFKDMKFNGPLRILITKISECSFGIYLVHVLFVALILKLNLLDFIVSIELKSITMTFTIFVLSFIAVMILKKIPRLGKILVR